MTRNSTPQCVEQGERKWIQDSSQEICQISPKRVDREWSPWEVRTNTSSSEFVEYNWREILVDFAHGGLKGDEKSEEITKRLRIVSATKNWWDADSNCRQLGGLLFSNLDGTAAQIQHLTSLLSGSVVRSHLHSQYY